MVLAAPCDWPGVTAHWGASSQFTTTAEALTSSRGGIKLAVTRLVRHGT
jgi:hypothetical protein